MEIDYIDTSLIQDKLVKPKLLLDLPTTPGPAHNGGKLIVGPDGNLYLTIGDLNPNNSRAKNATFSQAQNHVEGLKPDGRAWYIDNNDKR